MRKIANISVDLDGAVSLRGREEQADFGRHHLADGVLVFDNVPKNDEETIRDSRLLETNRAYAAKLFGHNK